MAETDSGGYEIEAQALTDKGRVRAHNEDYVLQHLAGDASERAEAGSLFVVCDGVGGSASGEVASKLAAERVLAAYYAASGAPGERLRQAIEDANQAVYRVNSLHPQQRAMHTTVVAAALLGERAWVANAGDSRAYLLHGGALQRLTEDHTVAQELVRSGTITPEEAAESPRRNWLTRSLGQESELSIDLHEVAVAAGDALVLCSDGLTRYVADEEIRDEVARHAAGDAARRLIDLANQRGGKDNVTVAIARLVPVEGKPVPDKARGKRRGRWLLWLALGLLVVAGLALLGVYLLYWR